MAGDYKGDGVESQHRSFGVTKDGYNDGGEPLAHHSFQAFGADPYHAHYPMQMFDRKLRPMDTLYVGLVCTKRAMSDQMRKLLIRQSPLLQAGIAERTAALFDAGEAESANPGSVGAGMAARGVCVAQRTTARVPLQLCVQRTKARVPLQL